MIVADTSALLAVIFQEPESRSCEQILSSEQQILMSAGTLAEARIVALGRAVSQKLEELLVEIRPEIVPVDSHSSAMIGKAYRQWGKGFHPAGLNFGDCFAYALAKERDLPLLFVGNDFARTDIRPAIGLA
ncbi:type II toxin-antitoxin system VapC family toxin [Rhizobium sp. CG5]|uniref:type II toxin-antitoxin system VapC family toxin n=1 Tax=Rhizobium sp. CG5 TaxID=2726076 RepID=UPI0020348426|nr:type II toxin-antitoxin system VapC family toxin [Rhizobium sp. CG5]